MPILAAEALLGENKKKKTVKIFTPSRNKSGASHNLWFQVQHYSLWTNWAFAYKTETLVSYIVMLYLLYLNPLSSSKCKNKVVHKQKFKDLLSST